LKLGKGWRTKLKKVCLATEEGARGAKLPGHTRKKKNSWRQEETDSHCENRSLDNYRKGLCCWGEACIGGYGEREQ